ncbi:MAG: phenylalanine--tRNA ligase subunit beta [Sedimentisphaerales bacterium]|nr:phenylalanine--tRNA ligase subunit beta [Sedimentisphaerales bacterium]
MKISLNWLNDYIETGLSAEQIAEILSDLGFPCEGIEKLDDDTVVDIEVTSNRGDCLGYIGVARELAVSTGKELKIPAVKLDESGTDVTKLASVEIREPELCGRYTARIVEGVKIGPSPDWIVRRLEAAGMRSVNNVVDATNYAMLETGQPPHAFDYDKLKQGKIIVRKAIAGERIVSIDGSKCDLNPDMLVIADAESPVAIAGVMGGLASEVDGSTTKILLEDAWFDPVIVRTTARKLSLPSEASFRFARIVDIEKVDWASQRTCQLITQLAGGKVARGVVDVYPKKQPVLKVNMRLARLKKLLGIEIPREDVLRILGALKFEPRLENDTAACTVPSWRSDVDREVDLIEEIARVYGYHKVHTEKKIQIEVTPVNARQKLTDSVVTYLNACGFYETINVSFTDNSVAGLFNEPDAAFLSVKDESRKSANMLRQTLIGSLMGVLQTNVNAKNLPCRIFEIAGTFVPVAGKSDGLPVEKTKLALVCDGDLRELSGVIEGLIRNISRDANVEFKPADLKWAQTGAQIMVNSQTIGTAGVAGSSIKEKFDFKEITSCAAEIDFEFLLQLDRGLLKVKPIPRFPAIQRDLSIIVDEQVPWSEIVKAVQKKASLELEQVNFTDIYRGKGIPSDRKSVTLSLQFRDEDGTLTHETVDAFQKEIVQSLAESVAAVLRDS